MAVSRTLVAILLAFIGLVIVLFLIIYFYSYPKKYVNYFNVSNDINNINLLVYALLYKRKKSNTSSFFIFLILALIIIIAVGTLYILSYKMVISINIGKGAQKLINSTLGR